MPNIYDRRCGRFQAKRLLERSVGINDVLASTKRPLGVVLREVEEWWAGLANAVNVNAAPVDSLFRLKRAAELCVAGGENADPAGRKELVMIDPSPELPDDMPIVSVELPPKVRRALTAAGLRTVGKIRETPDTEILRIQDLREGSLALLRKTLGLPSSMGVRIDAVPMPVKNEIRDH